MLIAQTSAGVARQTPESFELLDIERTLEELVWTGSLVDAARARIRQIVPLSELKVLPPIRRPGKICIVGLNYADHVAETGKEAPEVPRFSFGAGSAVTGPFDDIVIPILAPNMVDYEGELAVIIGSRATNVAEADAWTHVAGITIANDVSARDVQRGESPHSNGQNVGLGKSFDTFKPLGPAILTADELESDTPLEIRTLVDGEIRQTSNTGHLIFGPAKLVSIISRFVTLEPGDVILTGTPGGVGAASGRFLVPGQTVEVQLERLGSIRNQVVNSNGDSDLSSDGKSA